MTPFKFCPQCALPLAPAAHGGQTRLGCSCGYVQWQNPTPVVAAVVEHEGKIILARNALWPVRFFGLITGFLEHSDTSPEDAVQREVAEELGLTATAAHFIGHYRFERMNQLIIAYHVPAVGTVQLNEELSEFISVAPEAARYWPQATGLALRDWLQAQGHTPQMLELPKTR